MKLSKLVSVTAVWLTLVIATHAQTQTAQNRPVMERTDRTLGLGAKVDTSLGDWHNIGPLNFGGKVFDIAVNPTNPDDVFVAYGSGGLWRSPDGGASWSIMSDRYRNNSIGSVRINAVNPLLVIVGLGAPGTTALKQDDGVLKSADGGNTWKAIGPAVSADDSIIQVEFSINDPNTIYAASETALYRTTNGGAAWSAILTFNGQHNWDWMPSLALHPTDPNTILVSEKEVGIMRTSNGGITWTRVDQSMDQTNPISVLAWSKSNPNVVYCERGGGDGYPIFTYRSSDGGLTWAPGVVMNDFQQGRYDMALAVDPTNENRVLIANTGMFETLDGFNTYSAITAGHTDHLNVTFAPSNPQIVYEGSDGGAWKSAQAGHDGTWTRADVGVQTNKSFGIAVDPQSGKIYLSAGDYDAILYQPGSGWANMGGGYEWGRFYINPHDLSDVYESRSNGVLQAGPWQPLGPDLGASRPTFNPMAFDPVDAKTIYSATNRLWKSPDRGNTWTLLGPPIGQLPVDTSSFVSYITVPPATPTTIYVHFAHDGHLWKTTDGGVTWTGISGPAYGPNFSHALTVMPDNPGELFIGTSTGLYHSMDGGLTATPIATGLPTIFVRQIVIDPSTPERIFASTTTSVFFSQDRGNTWAQLGAVLPPIGVWDLELVGGTLYASTEQSIWELVLPQVAPLAPRLVSPGPSAAGYSVHPTLRWEWPYGATSFDVYFGTTPTPPLVANTTATFYTPAATLSNTVYYWKVVARNGVGTASSATWPFNTGSLPSPPVLISPANQTISASFGPSLTWASASGATSYDVYFGASSPPPLLGNTSVTHYQTAAPSPGTTYYWKIVAVNAAGPSPSSVWSFTTPGSTPSVSGLPLAIVGNRGSNDLSAYAIDASGTLTAVPGSPFSTGTDTPNSVAIDSIHGFVYVAPFGGDTIAGFSINRSTGTLTPISGSPFAVSSAIALAVDPGGRFVYVVGGQSIDAFTIDAGSGALYAMSGSPFVGGSRPHSIAVDPSGQFVYVADCGLGQGCAGTGSGGVWAYQIDAETGALTVLPGSPYLAGLNPNSIAVDPAGHFVYVTNSGSGNLSGFAISAGRGTLIPVPGSPFATGPQPSAVGFTPSGKFAYVSAHGGGQVATFKVDLASGTLAAVATVSTGSAPVSLATDPTGQYLFVANSGSNSVGRYTINQITGTIALIGELAVGTTPVSVATVALLAAAPTQTGTIPTVVEYYNPDLDNFFITADPTEQAFVDSGAVGRWLRTGGTFDAGGPKLVCRFYGNSNINPATGAIYGPNSHFYTVDANECANLKAIYTPNAKSWKFESNDFATHSTLNGSCTSGLTPVYRAYNNGFAKGIDSNHRITSSTAAIQEVVTRGWSNEGVVMCAPQ